MASILHQDIFLFFLKDKEFVSKTFSDSNIDLEKFPATVRQLAKKMESSKSTTRHVKQVGSDPQVAEVNLMKHQKQDLSPSKSKWKQHSHKSRSKSHKRYSSEHNHQVPPYQKRFDPNQAHQRKDRCSKCGDSKHIECFRCPARSTNAEIVIDMVIYKLVLQKVRVFQVQNMPGTSVASWTDIYVSRLHMWPVKRFHLQ